MEYLSDKSKSFSPKLNLNCNGKILSLEKPVVMGILNITPDSFYDGAKFDTEKTWLAQTEKMLKEGEAIIDIGAVSTRPGSEEIAEDKELEILLPVLYSIQKHFPEAILSVDTYRSKVAEIAISKGAFIINDISGGTFDEKMFGAVARLKAPYIIMHIKGTPKNMQINPHYKNVVKEIKDFFIRQLEKLATLGVTDNIVLDPGFGFGKTLEDNYKILSGLESFLELGHPVMAGVSRKSMINKVLKTGPAEALNGTPVLNTIALLNGANILRVHDVKEAKEAVRLVEAYDNAKLTLSVCL